MKNKSLIAVAIALVVVIVSAVLLYPKLSDRYLLKKDAEQSNVFVNEEGTYDYSIFENETVLSDIEQSSDANDVENSTEFVKTEESTTSAKIDKPSVSKEKQTSSKKEAMTTAKEIIATTKKVIVTKEMQTFEKTELTTVKRTVTTTKREATIAKIETTTTKSETTTAQKETTTIKLDKASDFIVCDSNGNEVSLSDFYGKPIVVNFWATWCGPCRSELPAFDNAYKKYGDRVNFLMVNLDQGSGDVKGQVQGFVNENGYRFPLYYDTKENASIAYGVSAIPQTLFITSDGLIYRSQIGTMSESNLNSTIERMLAQ